MDLLTKKERSLNMSRIKSQGTSIEITVRKFLAKEGYRYRKNYPVTGRPDIVFVKSKVAIFINGCFWHMHGCKNSSIPKSNSSFWLKKLTGNKERDSKSYKKLIEEGWRLTIVWECDLEARPERRLKKLNDFLSENKCLRVN